MIAKPSNAHDAQVAKIAAMIAKLPELRGPVAKVKALTDIYSMLGKLSDLHGSEATKIAMMIAKLPDLKGSESTRIETYIREVPALDDDDPELPKAMAKGAVVMAIAAIEKLPEPRSPEAKKLAAMQAKRPGYRLPSDPAFDPKNELWDLMWLALVDEDQARFRLTSPLLRKYFVEIGFSHGVADFIQMAVVKSFIDLLPKKRGRQWDPNRQRFLKAAAEWLKEMKQDLRASGEKGNVHKKAMRLFENEYERILSSAPNLRRRFPPFDYDAIENYVRRAKKRSSK